MVSISWAYQFVEEEKIFSLATPKLLDEKRFQASTTSNVLPWMSLYSTIVGKNHILPQLLYNLDETPMTLTDQYKYSELMLIGGQPPAAITPERMSNVTVLLTIPAIGAKLPTVILWPSKTVPQELAELRAYDILVLPNEGGWQTITSFEFIMRKIIIPAIVNKRKFLNYENEKALLVLDSHSSRFNSQVWKDCAANNIIALTIPSHTSHFLQPLDCGPNGVMKKVCFYEMIHALNPPAEGISVPALLTPISPHTKTKFISSQPKTADIHSVSPRKASLPYILAWQQTKDWINRLSQIRASRLTFHPQLIQHQQLTVTQSTPSLQSIPTETTIFTDTQLEEDTSSSVLRIRGGCRGYRKGSPDEDYQPPAEEKTDASRKRSLFAHAFPIALDKATNKSSIQAAWRNSGLYPINSALVGTHLHHGPAYPTPDRNWPLIAGRVLTDPQIIESIAALEKKRAQKKSDQQHAKTEAERILTTSSSRRAKALDELEQSMQTGPSASFWMPHFSKVIAEASRLTTETALTSLSSETYADSFNDPSPLHKAELRDDPEIVILPTFDNTPSEEMMNSQTLD